MDPAPAISLKPEAAVLVEGGQIYHSDLEFLLTYAVMVKSVGSDVIDPDFFRVE